MKKIIPYGRQNIDEDDIKSVVEALKSDFITQGPLVNKFERDFSNYVGSKYAVAVSNATAGLHLSVIALGLKKGERVITTPITFAASANCIRYCNGEVWFADIDEKTFLISYEKTKALIESKPKGFFSGIIPVNFGGLQVDLEKFNDLAKKNNLWIIEDAAHSPGSFFYDSNNKKIFSGSCKYSNLSVFSFHPVKHIACGEGGMITTNSENLYKKLLSLRTHGIIKNDLIGKYGGWYYEMTDLGYNYRLTDIQSALGISQLKKNKNGLRRRNEIAEIYKKSFEGIIKYQYTPNNSYNAYHLFVILVKRRRQLYDLLKSKNIFSQIHYIPIYKFPYYNKIDYNVEDFKSSEIYYDNCISLPMYPTLTHEEQSFVINTVLGFLNE